MSDRTYVNPFETRAQVAEWRTNALTRKFFAHLENWREELKEMWADGADLTPYEQKMAQCLGDIIGMSAEGIFSFYEEDNEEYDGREGA